MDDPQDRTSSVGRTAALLGAGQLITWGTLYYSFAVVLPAMAEDPGWSAGLLSAGFSLGLLVSGLLAPPLGAVMDRSGTRTVMCAGSIVGALGLVLWALASHPVVYLAGWLVIGAAMAGSLYEPAFTTIVREHPADRRAGLLAVTVVAALASPVFTPLTAWLVEQVGWRSCLLLLAGAVGITAELHRRLPSTPMPHGSPRRPPETPGPGTAESDREHQMVTVGVTTVVATSTAANAHLIAVLVDGGHPLQLSALIVASVGVAKIVGRVGLTITRAVERVGPVRLLVTVLLIQAAGLAAATGPRSTLVAVPLLFGSAAGAVTVLKPLAIAAISRTHEFARRSGTTHRASTFLAAAAPLLLGLVSSWTGSYQRSWWLLSAVPVAVAVGLAVRQRLRAAPV